MTTTQSQKAELFVALHQGPAPLLIPNPWDAGTAIQLATLGYRALATTSAGFAFSCGRPDGAGAVDRSAALDNARSIVQAVDLPVSGDLESGYGDGAEDCAATIRLAAHTGLVGGSIEDSTGNPKSPIYPLEHAVARVRAAAAAASSLPFAFTLTARAENLLHGRIDLADTIARLRAFSAAGADVLYAPGLRTLADIEAVVAAVAPKPVNVVMGLGDASFSVQQLAQAGVRRISVGSALARAAYGAVERAAREMLEQGTFEFAREAVPFAQLNARFSRSRR